MKTISSHAFGDYLFTLEIADAGLVLSVDTPFNTSISEIGKISHRPVDSSRFHDFSGAFNDHFAWLVSELDKSLGNLSVNGNAHRISYACDDLANLIFNYVVMPGFFTYRVTLISPQTRSSKGTDVKEVASGD